MDGWVSGLDTPETGLTTRAPAVPNIQKMPLPKRTQSLLLNLKDVI